MTIKKPPTLSPIEEENLIRAAKEAAAFVDRDGLDPDAAVAKAAADHELPPGKIRLLCHAYNIGRQTAQRRSNTTATEKFAAFPLADADVVIGRVRDRVTAPEPGASASGSAFGPPRTRKAASDGAVLTFAPPPEIWTLDAREQQAKQAAEAEGNRLVEKLADLAGRSAGKANAYQSALRAATDAKQASDQARMGVYTAEHEWGAALDRAVDYFRRADGLSLATVKAAADAYEGPEVQKVLSIVALRVPREARASDPVPVLTVDRQRAPFPAIRQAVKAAADFLAAQEAADQTQEDWQAKAAALEPEPCLPCVGSPLDLDSCLWAKAAALPGVITRSGDIFGSTLNDVLELKPPSTSDLEDKTLMQLDDPDHQNELRKVRVNAMLGSLMSDPDEPIAAHHPEQVMQAYNEIAQMAPGAAENMAVVRPLLRRRLQGQIEPFEAKEVADIENLMARNRAGQAKPEPKK